MNSNAFKYKATHVTVSVRKRLTLTFTMYTTFINVYMTLRVCMNSHIKYIYIPTNMHMKYVHENNVVSHIPSSIEILFLYFFRIPTQQFGC